MIIELGHFAVVLALILSLGQSILPLAGAARSDMPLMQAGRRAAYACFALVLCGFAALMFAHVSDDFSVLNVVMNSHSQKPLLYKITGTWASHEGSMLLWVLILSAFGAAIAKCVPDMPMVLRARALAVQGMIGFCFLAFILFTSNPFARVWPAALDGNDLNPLLQDPGLAFHPPFLYIGYVGFSSVFSLAAGLLLTGSVRTDWCKWLRPWALAAWASLTFGIAMGSWWSYYELGWGGWWFWDPVENAALMPWLAGTALIHSLLVSYKRACLVRWTVLLSIVTFSLSLLGTFLVRSGILTSVHTFASDPRRGLFILAILGLAVGGALSLYAVRASSLPESSVFSPVSRETALLMNNLFLCTACATVLTGTLYPLILDTLGGGTISVGPPYYNTTIIPLLLPVLILMAVGPFLRWHSSDLHAAVKGLRYAFALSLAGLAAGLYLYGTKSALGLVALTFGLWLLTGTLSDAQRLDREAFRLQLPRLLAHGGLAIAILGMAGSAFSIEHDLLMSLHQVRTLDGYRLEFADLAEVEGSNFQSARGTFYVSHGNHTITMHPEERYYPVQGSSLTDVAIHTNLIGDLYLAMGEEQHNDDGSVSRVIRFHINPLVPWIWIGGTIMALGGLSGLVLQRRAVS